METQTSNTSNKSKTVWIVIGVIAGLCLIACVIGFFVFRQVGSKMINTNPADVATVSDKIAEYDMPPGYQAQMSMSLLVYDMVVLAPSQSSANSMIIIMMQFNSGTNMSREEMQQQMQQAYQQQGGTGGVQMQVVETREETIRGETVTVTISEGTTEGVTIRQWMTVFRGNAGPTVLMIQGAPSDWDDDLITDFIHSIR